MSIEKTLTRGLAAAASMVMSPFAVSAPSAADRQFVADASAAADAAVAMGRVAADRASDPMVRSFARDMVADQSRATDQLHRLAAAKGLRTATCSAEQQLALHRLEQLTGSQFDREYLRLDRLARAQIIELFRNQAGVSGDPALKRFAAATLATLEQHQRLSDALPVRIAAS
jgi:putative membrane protein